MARTGQTVALHAHIRASLQRRGTGKEKVVSPRRGSLAVRHFGKGGLKNSAFKYVWTLCVYPATMGTQ